MKKTIITVLIVVSSLWVTAQETIADETTLTEMKSGYKVETDNDSVFKMTLQNLKPRSYTVTFKKDRYGEYQHVVLYYKKEDIADIRKWFAKL